MAAVAPPISEIQALAALSGPGSPERLLENTALLNHMRDAVRRALASGHLVTLASELGSRLSWPPTVLVALGVPIDLLDCFPDWRRGSRLPFKPGAGRFRLAPSGAAVRLGTLRLQISPMSGTIPHALRLLRDLLVQLDQDTRFVAVVEPGANLEALGALAARLHPRASSRVRFVPLRSITVFAQDNARAARDADGGAVLLVPRAFRPAGSRADDEIDPPAAERAFGIPVRRTRLFWEGGNIVHDDGVCFVGVDTVAENATRLGLAHDEILALLSADFGVPVRTLGRLTEARFDLAADRPIPSGQASFHVDLDVALLGRFGRARRPRALVADAARGLDFLDDVLAVRRLMDGHFLPAKELRRHLRAEYEAYAEARYSLLLEYAETLAEHGYQVIGVPDLRIDPKMDVYRRVNLDFGYCNVLPGLNRQRPSVHHFTSGVRALDADAAKRMRQAGVVPVPVSTPDVASALMLLQGGLHCCCGSM